MLESRFTGVVAYFYGYLCQRAFLDGCFSGVGGYYCWNYYSSVLGREDGLEGTACQIFRRASIFCPLMRTRAHVGRRLSSYSTTSDTSLLVIMTLRFTCGEGKICSTIKKSQNVINIIVVAYKPVTYQKK